MFEVVFGNKSVAKILIFLFVNGKCYGAQLQRIFSLPLTPLQKVLIRLEKGRLITSHYEGKTRIYCFNQAFALMPELLDLLKKAYTLLPPDEKKLFYTTCDCGKQSQGGAGRRMSTLLEFWGRLSSVKKLTFSAHSQSKEDLGWNGHGTGEVTVTKEGSNLLLFSEKGFWKGKSSQDINFANVFRWTLDKISGTIMLEHLRRGPENPVFLFHLAPSTQHSLSSVNSHLCGGDSYMGQVHFDRSGLKLSWRVIGPTKNEEMRYSYV